MKEYTYTNKSYLEVKEGIVPPAPQYLWLNSKDNRLYKFGDNGWEVTNNAPYIVEDFIVNDIIDIAEGVKTQLTISRVFLDAMYKSVPIMVKIRTTDPVTVPLKVTSISNPNIYTACTFEVTYNNIVYSVRFYYPDSITDIKAVDAHIITSNLADWNTKSPTDSGYIANRTHHLGYRTSPIQVGQRVSLGGTKGTHYIGNYKLLYDGKFYDLPTTTQTQVFISDYFKIIYNGYSESGNTSTYTFTSQQTSQTLPSQTYVICRDVESEGHKTLDEFFLPDGAKPWKTISATPHKTGGSYIFKDVRTADIANGENVLRDKVIYYANGKGAININVPYKDSVLEFKILAGGAQNISFKGEYVWENGGKPDTTAANDVIYSFLVLEGKVYASAKVF